MASPTGSLNNDQYGFQSKLICEYFTDENWILHEDLLYRSPEICKGYLFTIPAGFYTDFASVPAVFRGLISKYGRHARSAVLHDYLYYIGYGMRRSICDVLFNEAMEVEGEWNWRRRVIFDAVWYFGEVAWQKHRKHGHSEIELAEKLKTRTWDDIILSIHNGNCNEGVA